MIGALFNALAGRSTFGTTGRAIDASAGQRAIGMQLDRAGRQNAALQYSLAAGSRGAGQGLAIREAQRRAQLGMGQAAESAAIASQQLQQGVAEANQRASLQADELNQQVSLANAKNLQPLAMAGAAAAGGALSDVRAKMPLGMRPSPSRAEMPATVLPPIGDRYTFAPIDGSGLSVGQQEANIAVESAKRDQTAAYLGNTEPKFGAPGEVSTPRVDYVVSDPARFNAVAKRLSALQPGETLHVDPAMYERPVSIREAAYAPGNIGPTNYETPGLSTSVSRSGGDAPGWASALGGLLSDERSKQKIMELEATNRGLMKMLERQPAGGTRQIARLPVPQVPTVAAKPKTRTGQMQLAVERGQTFDPQSELEAEEYGRRWLENKRLEAMGDAEGVARFRQQLGTAQAQRDLAEQQYQKPIDVPYYEPTVTSDYRAKTLSDESAKDAVSYLRPIRPVAYQYRPEFVASGEGDPGPQVGLLAQHLERTPVGSTVVEQGSDGMKRVQVPQLLMLNTAADAEQQRQIDALMRRRRVG